MNNITLILLVRFKSSLSLEQVTRVPEERIDAYRALAGLEQKYYLQDPETGEYTGLYLWRSAADLAAFRNSELRASIAEVYRVEGQPRIEVYRVMMTLRDQIA